MSLGRDSGYLLRGNGNQLAIPIALGLGARDEVLERCCAQIACLREKLMAK